MWEKTFTTDNLQKGHGQLILFLNFVGLCFVIGLESYGSWHVQLWGCLCYYRFELRLDLGMGEVSTFLYRKKQNSCDAHAHYSFFWGGIHVEFREVGFL